MVMYSFDSNRSRLQIQVPSAAAANLTQTATRLEVAVIVVDAEPNTVAPGAAPDPACSVVTGRVCQNTYIIPTVAVLVFQKMISCCCKGR